MYNLYFVNMLAFLKSNIMLIRLKIFNQIDDIIFNTLLQEIIKTNL